MPVAFPLIRWTTPTAVVRSFSFPDYATDFSSQVVSSFIQSKTVGNIVSHYPKGAYDEVQVEYVGDFDQTFADEVRAWWSHAARGGVFDFFLEGDMTKSAPLYEYLYPPGSTVVVVLAGGAPFIAGRELIVGPVIASGDTAKRGSFTCESVTSGFPVYPVDSWKLSIGSPTTLIREHSAGEMVRSKYGFPDSVVLQNDYPLIEEPGLIMRFSLRLRSLAAIVVP